MSYEKHHSPTNVAIPELTTQDVKIKVIRQIFGIESNKLQPIIRAHNDTNYRVKYINIKPLNYYDIFQSKLSPGR